MTLILQRLHKSMADAHPFGSLKLPAFHPHPLLRNPHAQTVAGTYLPGQSYKYRATPWRICLGDGDSIVVHEDCPSQWRSGSRIVLLLHGLGGSHLSTYLVRLAAKLNAIGVRTFRMDLRGYGAGFKLARGIGHAGRSEDVCTVVSRIVEHCPDSPLTVVGFSKSANTVLKYLAELEGSTPTGLDSVIAVAPPIDLVHCGQNLRERMNRFYDQSFMKCLIQLVRQRHRVVPGLPRVGRLPERLWQFDDQYTAPLSGFSGVMDYYTQASAGPLLSRIRTPTLILTAADDPLIPVAMFDRYELSSSITLHVTKHGGHVGYIGVGGTDPDHRWMDWRIVDLIKQVDGAVG